MLPNYQTSASHGKTHWQGSEDPQAESLQGRGLARRVTSPAQQWSPGIDSGAPRDPGGQRDPVPREDPPQGLEPCRGCRDLAGGSSRAAGALAGRGPGGRPPRPRAPRPLADGAGHCGAPLAEPVGPRPLCAWPLAIDGGSGRPSACVGVAWRGPGGGQHRPRALRPRADGFGHQRASIADPMGPRSRCAWLGTGARIWSAGGERRAAPATRAEASGRWGRPASIADTMGPKPRCAWPGARGRGGWALGGAAGRPGHALRGLGSMGSVGSHACKFCDWLTGWSVGLPAAKSCTNQAVVWLVRKMH